MPFSHFHQHTPKGPSDQRARMLEAPVAPLICTLAVPTIISMMVTSIYNMADTYFVSQISTSASGAVGVAFSIMTMIQAVGFTVGMGAGSIAGQLMGQDRREKAGEYASSAVLMVLVLGFAFMAAGLLTLKDLMWWLGSTPTIYPFAVEYSRYIILGAPVMALSFTMNHLLRWQGKAKLAVLGLGAGGVLNIILDPIFIFVFKLGIAGASLATLLSQCVGLAILISFFLLGYSDIPLSPARISRRAGVYLDILKQGAPSFFRHGILALATTALNYNAKLYGDAAVAALSIVSKVFHFVQSIIIGFGQGFQPVIGYNYGAGRIDRVRDGLLFSLKACTAILTLWAVIGFAFAPQIIWAFRNDPDVIAIGTRVLRFQCVTMPLMALFTFGNMLFQSIGKSFRATLLAICRPGFSILFVYLLSWRFGLIGLELSQAAADLVGCLFSGVVILQLLRGEFKQPKREA